VAKPKEGVEESKGPSRPFEPSAQAIDQIIQRWPELTEVAVVAVSSLTAAGLVEDLSPGTLAAQEAQRRSRRRFPNRVSQVRFLPGAP